MKTLAQSRRLEERLHSLLKSWCLRTGQFAEHHCHEVAAVYRLVGEEVDQELRAWSRELLTIEAAAEETGYSAEHLRRLVRSGRILGEQGQGAKSRVRVRRGDLPAKSHGAPGGTSEPAPVYDPDEDARDIAKRLGGSNA